MYQEVTNMGIMKNIAQSEVLKLKDQVAGISGGTGRK